MRAGDRLGVLEKLRICLIVGDEPSDERFAVLGRTELRTVEELGSLVGGMDLAHTLQVVTGHDLLAQAFIDRGNKFGLAVWMRDIEVGTRNRGRVGIVYDAELRHRRRWVFLRRTQDQYPRVPRRGGDRPHVLQPLATLRADLTVDEAADVLGRTGRAVRAVAEVDGARQERR